jgi:hypothetical protein
VQTLQVKRTSRRCIFVRAESDLALSDEVAACYADPLRFVRVMYPWGFGRTS